MVMQFEAGTRGAELAPRRTGDARPTDPVALTAALVAFLEQALLATRRLLGALESVADQHSMAARPVPCAPSGALSRREAEVLRLLAAGRSTRQVAAALHLSPRTVQRHVANLYPKIGAHCRAEATAYALRYGLV